MIILGISVGYDKGAVLIKNGKVVVGITEERITRVPRDGVFTTKLPLNSIKYCLSYANLTYEDIDLYVWSALDDNHDYSGSISELTDAPRTSIKYIPHHLAHAYTAYASSPEDDTYILVADNHGSIVNNGRDAHSWFTNMGYDMLDTTDLPYDWAESTTIYRLNRDGGTTISKSWVQVSDELMRTNMASIYSRAARQLVFDRDNYIFNIENLTQLSSYSEPAWEKLQPKTYTEYEGNYELIYPNINYASDFRLKANVAGLYQREHHRVVNKLIKDISGIMESNNISLIGSLFRNARTMHKVMSDFKDLNIHLPLSVDDESIALGCALWGNWFVSSNNIKLKTPFLGNPYKDYNVFDTFEELDHIFQGDVSKKYFIKKIDTPEEMEDEIVELLLNNKIVGVFNGSSEFGIHPIGNRSILVNPSHRVGLDYMTMKGKEQEWWLKHNVMILNDKLQDVIKSPIPSPNSVLSGKTHSKWKGVVPTVINHKDEIRYTTSNPNNSTLMHNVLDKFYSKSGIPMVANIPLSVPLEPMVETPYEALRCMYTIKLSAMCVNNVLIIKK